MMKKTWIIAVCITLNFCAFSYGQNDNSSPAGMMRYPDISATHIVFAYANDIWIVPKEGGAAVPIASQEGQELMPRFSPDGKCIAFVGNYDGDRDIYTVPAGGGVPNRITHHPADEMLCDWSDNGDLVFSCSGFAGLGRQTNLFTVSPNGGFPKKLPVPYGANGTIKSDGIWLAYTPHSIDFRTWKRYRGGMATDIWLFNLQNFSSERVTTWEGTDTYPMWHGETLYYLCDQGPEHRLNIWKFDLAKKEHKQLTAFKDFDCRFPAIGPGSHGEGEIVFQNGSSLYVLNLASGEAKPVSITIPTAQPKWKERQVDAGKYLFNWDVSPTGKRFVAEARGDIWTLPSKNGSVINLTRSDTSAERYPSWSPDGQWIAYFSDRSGEYELYIMQSDGKIAPTQLTSDGKAWRYDPVWSPDSKHIVFTDKTGSVYLYTIETKTTVFVDKDPWAERASINWSHDSAWIVYTKQTNTRFASIWLYNRETKQSNQVTSGMFNDSGPTFDQKGDFLFFSSNRTFKNPVYDEVGNSFVYTDTDILVGVPLRRDVKNPYIDKNDVEKWGDEKTKEEEKDKESAKKKNEGKDEKDSAKKSGDAKPDKDGAAKGDVKAASGEVQSASSTVKDSTGEAKKEPLKIDLDGFEQRAFPLPVPNGGFSHLAVNHEGKLLYVRRPSEHSGAKPEIKIFDLNDEKKEEKAVLSDVGSYNMTADRKKLAIRKDNQFYLIDPAPAQKLENPVSSNNLLMTVNPRHEWKQIFTDAWRVQRDFFYDPNMHGVDWKAMRDHYETLLNYCSSREDLSFIISEMISELNVGHAYYFGGETESEPSLSVGLLGVDFELHDRAYRIAEIYRGAPWDMDARSPLDALEKDQVKVGDYLLAVNRKPLDPSKDPWTNFIGLADQTVTLTVSDTPKSSDKDRDVAVKLTGNESTLRYRAWIEKNRSYVDKKSGGKIGYIYVPNTGVEGQNDLFRQFYGQIDKQALIIDERWNGGGQIPTRFIELLNRPIVNYWARRDGKDWPWPPDAHQGPKCMLINGMAGSGGDAFPSYFRQVGLGKLIGTRTWGGLVGYTGYPALIDGGTTTAPSFAYYKKNGTWGIEGHGVDPDIEVIDDPAKMANGGDPQLDRAIELMQEQIKTNPYTPPARPAYPDRHGMGIREEDK